MGERNMNEWKEVLCLFSDDVTPEQMCKIRTVYALKWYVEKANMNKWIYYCFSVIGILCPLVNAVLVVCCEYKLITVLLSSITSMAASMLAITNAKSKWENYRSAAEFLKREYVLFQSGTGVYRDENRSAIYLQTIEDYMQIIHTKWQKIFDKDNLKSKSTLS